MKIKTIKDRNYLNNIVQNMNNTKKMSSKLNNIDKKEHNYPQYKQNNNSLILNIKEKINTSNINNIIINENNININDLNITNNYSQLYDINIDNTIHKIIKMVTYAAKHGICLNNATAYLKYYPCLNCAKVLVLTNIKTIYYIENNLDKYSKNFRLVSILFTKNKINIKQI